VQNRIADDLGRLLRSKTIKVETEPAIWASERPAGRAASEPVDVLHQIDSATAQRLVALAEPDVPLGLLTGEERPFSLNLTALSAALGLEISACIFGLARLGETGSFTSGACTLSVAELAPSQVFKNDNWLSLEFQTRYGRVPFPRLIPLLPELEVVFVRPAYT
jgi:hypothetical protein